MIDWLTDEVIQLKRDAIESIYDYRMTVYELKNVYNPKTGFDEPTEVMTDIVDQPCRISTQKVDPTAELPREYRKEVNLICAPELEIPPGCHIEITFYQGQKEWYERVSASRRYSDHQTLLLREYQKGRSDYA